MNAKTAIATTINGVVIGLAIGTTNELVFSAIKGTTYWAGVPSFLAQFDNMNVAVLIERLLYAGFGVICAFASRLYRNENRPIALTSAIHFAIILSTGIGLGVVLHWWRDGIQLLSVGLSIVIIYAIVWGLAWVINKNTVDQLNQKLAQKANG